MGTPKIYERFTMLFIRKDLDPDAHVQRVISLIFLPCTELIYVPVKPMINDDRKLIIDSANLNDRSMIGLRGGVVEETALTNTLKRLIVVGNVKLAGKFIQKLLIDLMAEHLGDKTRLPALLC